MHKKATVADLLLMPKLYALPRRGVQSALEHFVCGYSATLFAQMSEGAGLLHDEMQRILDHTEAEVLHESAVDAHGLRQGIYRLLFQDGVVGFVRMRLREDHRSAEPPLPLRSAGFHVDSRLAAVLANRLLRALILTEDQPARGVNAPVEDFLLFDGDGAYRPVVGQISDDTLRRLLSLDLSPWR
ncbi:hypothetical protein [Roseomonas sp. KE0001]|uniref:hypothetical protein n=1 Tax=unclassified Roseomonas TaxID=2617492 RepID=UPI0018DFBD5C|nr:hypothetical protein [Roseomonas sp. KE0001]MBI0433682.1 hypothetical protein [Roseomonas sp. KE0001]